MNKNLCRRLIKLYDEVYSDRPYKSKTVSFLIYNNKIVNFGVNSEKTNPTQTYWRRRANVEQSDYVGDKVHSEVACLSKIHNFNHWRHSELVVISKMKNGKMRLAKPCEICTKMLIAYGIHTVWYSTYEGKLVKEVF